MKKWLIIDGYNLVYQLPRDLPDLPADLAGKRRYLLRLLEETAGALAERVTVAFDGAQSAADPGEQLESDILDVRFSPPGKTADTVIEQLVCGAEHPEEMTVVTSDRPEIDNIVAAGAEAMSGAAFLDELRQARERLKWTVNLRAKKDPGFTIGDLFPDTK